MKHEQLLAPAPPAGSRRARRRDKRAYPLSLTLSLILHSGLIVLAYRSQRMAVMRGEAAQAAATFAVSAAPERSLTARARPAFQRFEGVMEEVATELFEVVEEELALAESEAPRFDLPTEVAQPELASLGGAPIAEPDWTSLPAQFSEPPARGASAPMPRSADSGAAEPPLAPQDPAAPTGTGGNGAAPTAQAGSSATPGLEGSDGPKLIRERSKEPPYPERARQRRLEGSVLLRITVSSLGKVSLVEVVESSGHKILDDAAVDAVEGWAFEPSKSAGIPVEATLKHRITFKFEN